MAENPAALLTSMIRPLLPREPVLDPRQRAAVEREVVDFVRAQIASLPIFLCLPVQIALWGFNWLAFLRFGHVYTALDENRQRKYLSVWAGSPVGPMRDLVKLVRSSALFVYLDHPQVLAQLESPACQGENGQR